MEPGDADVKTRVPSQLKTTPGVTASGQHAELKVLVAPLVPYPMIAQQLREEGTVVVAMEIGTDGVPTDVTLVQSSGFGSLDQAAMQAARKYKFQPPMRDGRLVTAKVEVPFKFFFKRN